MKAQVIIYILIYTVPFIIGIIRYKVTIDSLYTKNIIQNKLSNIKIITDIIIVYGLSIIIYYISYYILQLLKIPGDISVFLEIAIFTIPVIFYYLFINKLLNNHKIINDNQITKKISETVTIYTFISLLLTGLLIISYDIFLKPVLNNLDYFFDKKDINQRVVLINNTSFDDYKAKNQKKVINNTIKIKPDDTINIYKQDKKIETKINKNNDLLIIENNKNLGKENKIKLEILKYYGLTILNDTFNIDSEKKCTNLIKKYNINSNKINCENNYSGREYGYLSLIITKKGNDFYDITLGVEDLGGIILFRDTYDSINKKSYKPNYSPSKNIGFINIGKNNKTKIINKKIGLSKNILNISSSMKNEIIGNFDFIIDYKFKNNIKDNEKIELLKGNFPYILAINSEGYLGMGDSYKILKESKRSIEVFNNKGTYFTSEWISGNSKDIFISTIKIPNNKYFSEFVFYFLNTGAYNNSSKEKFLLDFSKNMKWTDNFIIN